MTKEGPKPEAYCGHCGKGQDAVAWLAERNGESLVEAYCGTCDTPQNTRKFFRIHDQRIGRLEEEETAYETRQATLYTIVANESSSCQTRAKTITKLDESRLVRLVSENPGLGAVLTATAIVNMKTVEPTIAAIIQYQGPAARPNHFEDNELINKIHKLPDATLRAIVASKKIRLTRTEKRAGALLLERMNAPDEDGLERIYEQERATAGKPNMVTDALNHLEEQATQAQAPTRKVGLGDRAASWVNNWLVSVPKRHR